MISGLQALILTLIHLLLARNTALAGINPNAEGGICKPSRNDIVLMNIFGRINEIFLISASSRE
ncbi:hypothetical protein A6S26_12980 [Nostoc sp. ATCC 43529]|nr:hypothetical protein A6S26_12980 [Nostoc sp. ATCC 43529]